MEVDITSKVKYFLKFGLIGLVCIAACASGIVYKIQQQRGVLTIEDAKVTGSSVAVRTMASGKLTALLVEDGAHVEANEKLASLAVSVTEEDIRQLEETVALSKRNLAEAQRGTTITTPIVTGGGADPNAAANLAAAEARASRMNELFAMGAISAVKRDEAAAAVEAARAAAAVAPPTVIYETTVQPPDPAVIRNAELQVKQAEAALDNAKRDSAATDIIAPLAGTVFYTELRAGDEVKAGDTILRLGTSGDMWVEGNISPERAESVHLGQLATYEVGSLELSGTVIDIAPADSGLVTVKVSTPTEARLTPGTTVAIRLKL